MVAGPTRPVTEGGARKITDTQQTTAPMALSTVNPGGWPEELLPLFDRALTVAAAADREERKMLEALDAPLTEAWEATETLYSAALVAAGYRQHNRVEWRKRRAAPVASPYRSGASNRSATSTRMITTST